MNSTTHWQNIRLYEET